MNSPCPNCGYCPTCGRGNYHNPFNYNYNQPYVTYTGIGSIPTVTNTGTPPLAGYSGIQASSAVI